MSRGGILASDKEVQTTVYKGLTNDNVVKTSIHDVLKSRTHDFWGWQKALEVSGWRRRMESKSDSESILSCPLISTYVQISSLYICRHDVFPITKRSQTVGWKVGCWHRGSEETATEAKPVSARLMGMRIYPWTADITILNELALQWTSFQWAEGDSEDGDLRPTRHHSLHDSVRRPFKLSVRT